MQPFCIKLEFIIKTICIYGDFCEINVRDKKFDGA